MIVPGQKAIVQFSGGKDSTALMYYLRDYMDQVVVMFGDTGMVFPHVKKHVLDTVKILDARLVIVMPEENIFEFQGREGLPLDIVPIEAQRSMSSVIKDYRGPYVQSYMNCCTQMLFAPLYNVVKQSGITTVIRGIKKTDARGAFQEQYSYDGIDYVCPLWNWTDEDVTSFLNSQGVTLPDHYATVNDSLDCWGCTAHLKRHGKEKMEYIREKYPELWPQVNARLETVKTVLYSELGMISPALNKGAH